MKRGPSDRRSFDPSQPPPTLPFEEESHLIVLLATPLAEASSWSAETAVSLARQWAATGERVFLADLDFARPSLHEVVGVENEEGVSDAFVYGASLPRVAKAAKGGFFFASAGTPVFDPAAVLTSGRWELFQQGFRRAGARLLVYAPSDSAGIEHVLERCDEVVLLRQRDDDAGDALVGRATVVLEPPDEATPSAAPESPPRAATASDLPGEAAAGPVRPGASSVVSAGGSAGRGSSGRGSRLGRVLFVLILVAVVVGLLAFLGVLPGFARQTRLPAVDASRSAGIEAAVGERDGPESRPRGRGASEAEPVTYALALGSFSNLQAARQELAAVRRRVDDVLLVVSPVEVGGAAYYRLLAGSSTDPEATDVRRRLGEALRDREAADWIARPASLGFRMGRFADLAEARARADVLDGAGVPAYVLAEDDAFVVWAGAYADAAEASFLAEFVRAYEPAAALERRRGTRPE